ncbi:MULTISPECIES: alkene reductase [unclassified Microbacterium]|uniref:alkene reductase n=1 Tax=unclassified Microbacterium TaxID=2609290 RepID=UPI000CFC530D|nr:MULTISPECIES: alkene reductase [unclassified Microbacterium]PQZ50950.1 alkene reductase [Microbacterium sp. MYb43]PQZ69693.1 alkene reductase [Microbacterium sp. MYb40]PRB16424.1 alkene reductase [Microbacterium sp. MYb54]PRB31407.1 alkene reductase [Microbacterium sp. MYb50]PRB67689.1 alkene reductase [Microbacterium sp. MYb32]
MTLYESAVFGALQLSNRVVMAPLTRTRADDDGVPTATMEEYYRQRAGQGLIISEGVWPVAEGKSYPGQPGIVTPAQIEAWKPITEAVHDAGGTIVMQLMHGGRVGHPAISGAARVVGPSALAAPGQTRTPEGKADLPVAHALTLDEIPEVVEQFAQAARNAIAAGFDGVEVHGANGYLVHEFLSPVSNIRDDRYGGSPENRARFAIEVTAAVAAAVGADRTGIRLSPQHNIQGVLEEDDADVRATYTAVAEGFAPLGLAFIDVLNADPAGELVQHIRRTAGAPLIVNTGFTLETTREDAEALVADGWADAVAVGRPVIANPDLVERWIQGAELNDPRPELFYGRTAEGYSDYPSLESVRAGV